VGLLVGEELGEGLGGLVSASMFVIGAAVRGKSVGTGEDVGTGKAVGIGEDVGIINCFWTFGKVVGEQEMSLVGLKVVAPTEFLLTDGRKVWEQSQPHCSKSSWKPASFMGSFIAAS